MRKLLFLLIVGAVAVGGYNYSQGHDLVSMPGIAAGSFKNAVRDTVKGTVRDGVRSAAHEARDAAREVRDEVKDHAFDVKEHAAEAALTTKIKAKMALDDKVTASAIDVDSNNTVVTLTGTVASKDEQKRAVRIATETSGVTRVVDHLRVR